MQITLNLLEYKNQLQVKQVDGKKWLRDPIRKKYLVWQPEELVRQLFLQCLIHEKKYNKNRIHTERGLKVNGEYKRCDIIVYDLEVSPYLLVECKAPTIALNQKVFNQIAQYNLVFQVPYLVVTNGIVTYCCTMDYEKKQFEFLEDLPEPR